MSAKQTPLTTAGGSFIRSCKVLASGGLTLNKGLLGSWAHFLILIFVPKEGTIIMLPLLQLDLVALNAVLDPAPVQVLLLCALSLARFFAFHSLVSHA